MVDILIFYIHYDYPGLCLNDDNFVVTAYRFLVLLPLWMTLLDCLAESPEHHGKRCGAIPLASVAAVAGSDEILHFRGSS